MKRFYGKADEHLSQPLLINEHRIMDITACIDEHMRELTALKRLADSIFERRRARLTRLRTLTLEAQGDLAVVRALCRNFTDAA